MEYVEQGKNPVARDKTQIGWPVIDKRQFVGDIHLEPGEAETLYFDHLIDDEVKTVVVYSYLQNNVLRSNKGNAIGWSVRSVYDLEPAGEGGNVYEAGSKEE